MKAVVLRLRVTADEMAGYKRAAEHAGDDLSAWVRGVLNADVRQERPLDRETVKADLKAIAKVFVPDDAALNALPEVDVNAAIEVAKPGERLVWLDDGTMLTEAQHEEMLVTGNVVMPPEPGIPITPPDPEISLPADEWEPPEPIFPGGGYPEPIVPSPPPVSLPEPKPTRKMRSGFKRAPKCTSSKCERLQAPTCAACKHANAEEAAGDIYLGGEPVVIPPWPKRSPGCITSKCARLRAPACDPCRRFNAEIEF